MQRLLEEGSLHSATMENVPVHMIADNELMRQLSAATKAVPAPQGLHPLYVPGIAAFEALLRKDADKIRRASSADPGAMFD